MALNNDVRIISNYKNNAGVALNATDQDTVILSPSVRIERTKSKDLMARELGLRVSRNIITETGLATAADSYGNYVTTKYGIARVDSISGATYNSTLGHMNRHAYTTASAASVTIVYNPGNHAIGIDTKRIKDKFILSGSLVSDSSGSIYTKVQELNRIADYGGTFFLAAYNLNSNIPFELMMDKINFVIYGGRPSDYEYTIIARQVIER